MLPKPLSGIEHVGTFFARRFHLGFHQLDLALLDLKGTLRDLRPVELHEVLDNLQRGDDKHVNEALRGLQIVNLHRFRVVVQRPFDLIADLGFGQRLG